MFGDGENKGEQIKGKKILIKSDGIFISGRDNIRLISVNNVSLKSKGISLNSDDVNLGNEADEPVVKGNELVTVLEDLVNAINSFATQPILKDRSYYD